MYWSRIFIFVIQASGFAKTLMSQLSSLHWDSSAHSACWRICVPHLIQSSRIAFKKNNKTHCAEVEVQSTEGNKCMNCTYSRTVCIGRPKNWSQVKKGKKKFLISRDSVNSQERLNVQRRYQSALCITRNQQRKLLELYAGISNTASLLWGPSLAESM